MSGKVTLLVGLIPQQGRRVRCFAIPRQHDLMGLRYHLLRAAHDHDHEGTQSVPAREIAEG